MFQKLVSLNEDLRRLVKKGYAVAFDGGYLIVRDIPYLGPELELRSGAIVAKLVFVDNERVVQDDHQVYFAGSHPHGLDGNPIPNLSGGPIVLPMSEANKDVVVERSFSNKPVATGAFADFYEKIESYVGIISGPAIELHKANPYTFRFTESVPETVFKFQDTLTSRAEITDLSAKFRDDDVAVIGLGGTGAYVLDFLVKTPVREIRGFDLDEYHVHNAFRSPGRLEEHELGQSKADVYRSRYENFRHGLTVEPLFVDSSSHPSFEGVTFAFVCVDEGPSRAGVFDVLIGKGIPFIDVGMGLKRKEGALTGMARVTHFSTENAAQVRDMGLAELTAKADDMYRTNIQISELNALNASLAVIKFKQLRGFYGENAPSYHLLFDINDFKLVGESELP